MCFPDFTAFRLENSIVMEKVHTETVDLLQPHIWDDIWMFPKIGGFFPQNGWFIMEHPIKSIKIDDLGYPYFWKHPYFEDEIYQKPGVPIDGISVSSIGGR